MDPLGRGAHSSRTRLQLVPVALAEIAAGLPLAASFALAGGISSLREGRRRAVLNEALHELRRPLQALILAAPAEDPLLDRSLRIATAAVERLDREINGERKPIAGGTVAVRPLAKAAVRRWRPRAELEGRSLRMRWNCGSAEVCGDGFDLAQALDNLIINGIEHGAGDVLLEASCGRSRLRLAVRDRGRPDSLDPGFRLLSPRRLWRRATGRDRRGHGLRVVRRTAAALDGSFRLQRDAEGTAAILELPLCDEECR